MIIKLHVFSAMNTIFEEQYFDLSWNTFANQIIFNDQYSNQLWNDFLDITDSDFTYSNVTLQNPIDYEAPVIDSQETFFFHIPQDQAIVENLTEKSTCTHQAQQQQYLENESSTVESEKTEFEEIKTLYERGSTIMT